MTGWNRRDLLKPTLAAAAASVFPPNAAELLARAGPAAESIEPPTAPAGVARERILLDADWRFLLGHAGDPRPEFNGGNFNGFNKPGDLYPPSNPKFADGPGERPEQRASPRQRGGWRAARSRSAAARDTCALAPDVVSA